ncbi:hypothetical protein BaRGS_00017959 [Batillaria attramentaria]|uniref:HTH psq-type domain-containing protein n=1 Tax=Batillaria attramentaria TaxID=370345 RepID=A0ABD0KU84_9CAEN
MVRTYRRKTDRGKYGEENLSAALEAVSKGVPLIRASKEFGVPAPVPDHERCGYSASCASSGLTRSAPQD